MGLPRRDALEGGQWGDCAVVVLPCHTLLCPSLSPLFPFLVLLLALQPRHQGREVVRRGCMGRHAGQLGRWLGLLPMPLLPHLLASVTPPFADSLPSPHATL